MAEAGFNFQKLIDDSKNVLVSPKQYFSSMAKEGGFGEPVIKALIYGVVAGIIGFIWALLSLSFGMFGTAGAVGALIGYIIGAVIGLFISGIIILIISAICGGSTNFETNVRVSAALMVLLPISVLLVIFNALSLTLGAIISLIIWLYGLYLLYNALVNTLGAKEGTSKIISIVLGVIALVFFLGGLMCASTATKISSDMMKKNIMSEEQIDKIKKMTEEMQKK